MKQYVLMSGVLAMIFLASCSSQNDWSPVSGDIMTQWAKEVNPHQALPEYPRPQMARKNWKNLNGLWEYGIRPREESQPQSFDGQILVPFPVESALSGVKKAVGEENKLWYRHAFKLPKKWLQKRVILHFGAVDWETTVWINGKEIGKHRGGYDAFSFDITDFLNPKGQQEIVVAVWDPIDSGYQPRGKQVNKPGGIWYTSVTGIWQTVWLEPVPDLHLESLKIIPDVDQNQVKVQALCSGTRPNYQIHLKIKDGGQLIAEAKGVPFEEVVAKIENPKLWSPDNPFLYDLDVTLLNDKGQVIDQIKQDPNSRRLIVNAWNVGDIGKMALPPCHLLFQFYVADGKLSCQFYQRSADVFLGVPFNIASYALLTMMVAQVCDLRVGELIQNMGDTHLYLNHISQAKLQLSRQPYPLPSMILNPDVTSIYEFTYEDFELLNYQSHPHIKAEISI